MKIAAVVLLWSSAYCAVATAATVVPDSGSYPLSRSDWDWQLPALELANVYLEGDDLIPLWKQMASAYMLRCNLYAKLPSSGAHFSYASEHCRTSELLDALTTHFGYAWNQDARTGILWIYPGDMDIDGVLGEQIILTESAIAAPMHSGIIEPIAQAFPWGTYFTKGWSDLWRGTLDYPVSIPKANYAVREVLNRCCLWSPKQAFLVTPDNIGVQLLDVHLATSEYKTPSPGSRLFWEVEIGPLAEGERPSDEELGMALRAVEPRKRWAARSYLGMCSETENTMSRMLERLPTLALNEDAAWEVMGVANTWNMRPDKFPIGDVISGRLKELCAPEVLGRLSPEAALMVVLSTAAYTGDDNVLARLSGLKGFRIGDLLYDLVRLGNFSPAVSSALYDKQSPYYVGGKLDGLPALPRADFQKLQFKVAE